MPLHQSRSGWVVQAPAKLNLFFEVLAKRNDGYHEIETLVCPIDLYDTLYFRKELGGQVNLQCDRVPESGRCNGRASDDAWGVPLPAARENIALRAAELLRRQAGVDCGAALRLVKRSPIAAC